MAIVFPQKRVHRKLCKPPLSDKIKDNGGFALWQRTGKRASFASSSTSEGSKIWPRVHELVKELTSGLIQGIMDAELESELGYSKYDYKNKETDNARNGHYKKTVISSQGDVDLKIPRDRNGDYEPQIVKKHQMDISDIEDKILFLYSQGTSTRDIEKTMQEMYDIEVGRDTDEQDHGQVASGDTGAAEQTSGECLCALDDGRHSLQGAR